MIEKPIGVLQKINPSSLAIPEDDPWRNKFRVFGDAAQKLPNAQGKTPPSTENGLAKSLPLIVGVSEDFEYGRIVLNHLLTYDVLTYNFTRRQ